MNRKTMAAWFLTIFMAAAAAAALEGEEDADLDPRTILRCVDGKTGKVLFTDRDIERFDWEKQVFELSRECAMDLMSCSETDLKRPFTLHAGGEVLYRGMFVCDIVSSSFAGPTIVLGSLPWKPAPPLFRIDGGYPDDSFAREEGKVRFSRRLKELLERAGLLEKIDLDDPPEPIVRKTIGWAGEREKDGFSVRFDIFPETFRFDGDAKLHLFFIGEESSMPRVVEIETVFESEDETIAGRIHHGAWPLSDILTRRIGLNHRMPAMGAGLSAAEITVRIKTEETSGLSLPRVSGTAPDSFRIESRPCMVTVKPASESSRQESHSGDAVESVRRRLVEAAKRSRDLMAAAEEADPEILRNSCLYPIVRADWLSMLPARFPRESHVRQYRDARPWSGAYAYPLVGGWKEQPEETWPTLADLPALRILLTDRNAVIRSLAAEVLAALHQPEDPARIATLLWDLDEGAPVLGWNGTYVSNLPGVSLPEDEDDRLDIWRSWHHRTVRSYALNALHLMTGRDFTRQSFPEWWVRQREPEHSLWFWQRRLEHLIHEVATPPLVRNPQEPVDIERQSKRMAEWHAGLDARRREIGEAVLEELRRLPPEVEAKIVLLSGRQGIGSYNGVVPQGLFFDSIPDLRLEPGRLLDLLDRKGLWDDVTWDDQRGRELYNRMVCRIALSAEKLFSPADKPRLEALLACKEIDLWWKARSALLIAVSRLSSDADPSNLDETGTRDAVLRSAIRTAGDGAVRCAAARELIRAGLSRNLGFIEEFFFRIEEQISSPDLRQSILIELGCPPLTDLKRRILINFLTDSRSEPFWTRPSKEMGDSLFRRYAIRSINAHAGEELLTNRHARDLWDPEKSSATLEAVVDLVRALDRSRARASAPWRAVVQDAGFDLVDVTPDGRHVLSRDSKYGDSVALHLIDTTGPRVVQTIVMERFDFAALSPDGRTIAVSARSRIFIFDSATGRKSVLLENAQGALAFSSDGSRLALLGWLPPDRNTGKGNVRFPGWGAPRGSLDLGIFDVGGKRLKARVPTLGVIPKIVVFSGRKAIGFGTGGFPMNRAPRVFDTHTILDPDSGKSKSVRGPMTSFGKKLTGPSRDAGKGEDIQDPYTIPAEIRREQERREQAARLLEGRLEVLKRSRCRTYRGKSFLGLDGRSFMARRWFDEPGGWRDAVFTISDDYLFEVTPLDSAQAPVLCDGRLVTMNSPSKNDLLVVTDCRTGDVLLEIPGDFPDPRTICHPLPDGLLVQNEDKLIRYDLDRRESVWEKETPDRLRLLPGAVVVLNQQKRQDGARPAVFIEAWDTATGKRIGRTLEREGWPHCLGLDLEEDALAILEIRADGRFRQHLMFHSLASGEVIREAVFPEKWLPMSVHSIGNGEWIVSSHFETRLILSTGETGGVFPLEGDRDTTVVPLPGSGGDLFLFESGSCFAIIDRASRKVRLKRSHGGCSAHPAFRGKVLMRPTGLLAEVELIDLSSMNTVCTVHPVPGEGEFGWIVTTPDGFWDASADAARFVEVFRGMEEASDDDRLSRRVEGLLGRRLKSALQ